MAAWQLVHRVDRVLGSDPRFGSAAAIEARNLARYRLGIRLLSRHHHHPLLYGIAALDAPGLRPLYYDPVLRDAFERDLLAPGDGQFAAYLRNSAIAARPDSGPCERLMRPRVRPWPELGGTWVWTTPQPGPGKEKALAARLDELLGRACVHPDGDMQAMVRRGGTLLAELLPRTGPGLLSLISMVGIANEPADGDSVPSTVVLTPERLAGPWSAAEGMLLAGLHIKLCDVLRTCSFVREPTMLVPIPWRVTHWTILRVVSALHAYCHLMLMRQAVAGAPAEIRDRYGEPPPAEPDCAPTPGSRAARDGGWRTVPERARYLAQQICEVYGDGLTADGIRFVDWLLASVAPLAPAIGGYAVRAADGRQDEVALNAGGYRRAEPVTVCPLPEQDQLLALSPEQPRFRWLNTHAWLIYTLCDGGDLDTLRRRHQEAIGADRPAHLADGIAALLSAGLIVPISGGSKSRVATSN